MVGTAFTTVHFPKSVTHRFYRFCPLTAFAPKEESHMFVKITTLAAAVLVNGIAIAQEQQQPRIQQPEAIQNQPKAPECWDTHTNQVRERTAADSQANQPGSTVGSAQSNAPANRQNTPGGTAQRPAVMANC